MNIAYHWKRKTTPILCIATGISRTASAISRTAWWSPCGAERISTSSSSGRGELLGPRHRESARSAGCRPCRSEADVHPVGHAVAGAPAGITFCRTNSDRFASTAPAPVNRLWVRKPRASCDLGNRSEMNARYGSIEVLLPASSSQKQITPSHRTPTNGNRNRMIAQSSAPAVMNGRRRPQRGCHVRSLIAPISGWMSSPVTGPARLRIGRSCGFAPMSRKSGFTADWVRPKLNWTPKNPRFIISRARPVISGLCSTCPAGVDTDSDVVTVMATPSADAIQARPSLRS